MPTLLSAGISVTESDLIAYVPPVSSSIAAYVGHFNWGPADQLVNVSSEKELATIFGAPKINAGSEPAFIPSYLTAAAFFNYGNSMRVVRSVPDTAKNAVAFTGETYDDPNPGTSILIKNKEEFDIYDFGNKNDLNLIYARYPGTLGNGLEVQFYHESNAPVSEVNKKDPITGKKIETLAGDCKALFGKVPTTTYWAKKSQLVAIESDEIYVVVLDTLGYFSGTPGAVLELYQGLSLQSGAKTETGGNNYYVDVINTGSSYIYINEHADTKEILARQPYNTFKFELTHGSNFTFGDGLNGVVYIGQPLSDTCTSASVVKTLSLPFFLDIENTNIDLLCAESFENDVDGASTIKEQLLTIGEIRRDLIVFISAPLDLYRKPATEKLQYVLNARNNQSSASSSFAFYDNTPVYVYNKYTDKYYWIPACTHMAGLCAYTDTIADPWFSPAGLNRGQLRGVTKLAYNASQQDRDDLYNDNINAIISIPGNGIVLYGDKTGLSRPSSFDRINVRRLFIVIEKACRKASKYQLFELNDEFTQRAFRNTIDPYLRDIQSRRGIIAYAIVCDATNNTSAVVTTNRFVADIYIKPAFSINYIQLNFIATRDTVTFTQISG